MRRARHRTGRCQYLALDGVAKTGDPLRDRAARSYRAIEAP